MTSTEIILELLEHFSPSEIYQLAKMEQEKKEKAEAAAKERAEHEAKVKAARDKVIEAMKEYSKAMYGTEPDIKLMDNFNSDLKDIEAAANGIVKKVQNDDETIRRFLRGIL